MIISKDVVCLENDFNFNSSLTLTPIKDSNHESQEDVVNPVLTKVCVPEDERRSVSHDTPVQRTVDNQPMADAMIDSEIVDINPLNNSLIGDVDPPTASTHSMIKRARNGISRPNLKYLMQVSTPPPVPTTIASALSDPLWNKAMTDETEALNRNSTWILVPCDTFMNLLSCKWVYKHKLDDKGKVIRHKAQ